MYENRSLENSNENTGKNGTSLILIPKYQDYIKYMINVLNLIPRIEKYSIGTEFKVSMYNTLENILCVEKVDKNKRIGYLNIIDAKINMQRIYLRILLEHRWTDQKKFNVAMEKLYEIGKILGGLIKYYGKNYQKYV